MFNLLLLLVSLKYTYAIQKLQILLLKKAATLNGA